MKVQTFIIVSLFAGLLTACSDNTDTEPGKVKVKEITIYDNEDAVELPPPHLTSNFDTLQDWLSAICDNEKPEKSIANYTFGLFESPYDDIIFLVGVNQYDKGDTSYTRIDFEPKNMHYKLPKSEYINLSRDQLLNKLTDQLRKFVNTQKFKTSFLSNANAIDFETNGQTIWSK